MKPKKKTEIEVKTKLTLAADTNEMFENNNKRCERQKLNAHQIIETLYECKDA